MGIVDTVNKTEIALLLAEARLRSQMTQAELATAMGTTQPAVARAESGYRMPRLEFIDRWALATGSEIPVTFGRVKPNASPSARRAVVRSVLGPGRFNPWDRNPSPVEAALLENAGLSRKYFERVRGSAGQRPRARSTAS